MIDLKQIDMKDLNEILESESLSDFRMDFDRQISDLENHPNGMKRYIMLCLMAEMTLARIENADPPILWRNCRSRLMLSMRNMVR